VLVTILSYEGHREKMHAFPEIGGKKNYLMRVSERDCSLLGLKWNRFKEMMMGRKMKVIKCLLFTYVIAFSSLNRR
jgi:hypothetical protein